MHSFSSGRGGGKTHQAFTYLKEQGGGALLVSSERMAEHCRRTFGPTSEHRVHFITWSQTRELQMELRSRGIRRIAIDDLDMYLEKVIGGTVDFATFHGEQDAKPINIAMNPIDVNKVAEEAYARGLASGR